ncbi:MAG: AmmeMemoRadiSam system protein A [Gammaproteobacteria bacterium]
MRSNRAHTTRDHATGFHGLAAPLRRRLADIAWASIRHGLTHHRALDLAGQAFPPRLLAHRSAFVTLHRGDTLRGCVGSIETYRPLVEDVAANAYAAAFEDPRFEAVRGEELPDLAVHIAVLSATTVIAFASEQDLCDQIRPGVDGIVIEQGERRATFLPAVWDTLPNPAAFLRELRRKAGIPPADGWLDLRVWRYTVESFAA